MFCSILNPLHCNAKWFVRGWDRELAPEHEVIVSLHTVVQWTFFIQQAFVKEGSAWLIYILAQAPLQTGTLSSITFNTQEGDS